MPPRLEAARPVPNWTVERGERGRREQCDVNTAPSPTLQFSGTTPPPRDIASAIHVASRPPSSSPAEPPQRLAGLRAGFCAMRKLTCRRDVATTITGLEQGVSRQQCPMQLEAPLQVQTLRAPRIDTREDGLSLSQPMTTLGAATAARFPSRQCRSGFTLSTT